jgi:ribosome-associated toxin RatA of RatAB toxin-antitoxin module
MVRLNHICLGLSLLLSLSMGAVRSMPLSSTPDVSESFDSHESQAVTSGKPPLKPLSVKAMTEPKVDNKSSAPKENSHLPEDTLNATINAPVEHVWKVLSDFSNYPRIFDRVKEVNITKREGDLVYIESKLKPHMFVNTEVQHTVNDLSGKPGVLKWQLLDGNFKHIDGLWEIKSTGERTCHVSYTLKVDPGPFIPGKMVSFLLHFVEKEVVVSLKKYAEKTYTAEAASHSLDLSYKQ